MRVKTGKTNHPRGKYNWNAIQRQLQAGEKVVLLYGEDFNCFTESFYQQVRIAMLAKGIEITKRTLPRPLDGIEIAIYGN